MVREKATDNVAVIDTGINLSHPDLNAVNGKDCVDPGTPAEDENGHGTHVSGTIGAKNNGPAWSASRRTRRSTPSACSSNRAREVSQMICGIDWVANTAGAKNIQVANMSLGGALGGPPTRARADAFHQAICNSTGGGRDLRGRRRKQRLRLRLRAEPRRPAAYKEVLTVTALSDSDGKPGAHGPRQTAARAEFDDRPATFSNFAATSAGEKHTIAAPGVCILSTWLSGGYNTISGTSMASPHMAGVAALCHGEVGSAAGPCARRRRRRTSRTCATRPRTTTTHT